MALKLMLQFLKKSQKSDSIYPMYQVLKMTEFLAVPLAHIRLHIREADMRRPLRISARGDTQLIVHFLKRKNIKIFIPPSREYDPESTVPLAGMQSKFYIPASGDFVIISVRRPRERRYT